MATPTYEPIANTTLASAVSSVTFSNISQAYKDLIIVVSTVKSGGDLFTYTLNSSNSGYNYVGYYGGSGNATSVASTGNSVGVFDPTYYTEHNMIANLMDYSSTDKYKNIIFKLGNGINVQGSYFGKWSSLAAVTSISFGTNSSGQTFAAGSTFAIYGVSA